jgi:hypothetical protein
MSLFVSVPLFEGCSKKMEKNGRGRESSCLKYILVKGEQIVHIPVKQQSRLFVIRGYQPMVAMPFSLNSRDRDDMPWILFWSQKYFLKAFTSLDFSNFQPSLLLYYYLVPDYSNA